MKTKMIAMLFVAGSSMFAATHVYFGVRVGGYAPAPARVAYYGPAPVTYYNSAPVAYYAAPPAAPVAYMTPAPGPGYTWVAGYWYPVGPRWSWQAGYWARPPYARASWVTPRYFGGRFYAGRWR